MAMNSRAGAHVNRFRNYVAAFIGRDGSTYYMHPTDAEKLAVALMAAAADVRRYPFAESRFLPFNMELRPDGRENDVPGDEPRALTPLENEFLGVLEALFEHCVMTHKHWGDGCNEKEAFAAKQAALELIDKVKGAPLPPAPTETAEAGQ